MEFGVELQQIELGVGEGAPVLRPGGPCFRGRAECLQGGAARGLRLRLAERLAELLPLLDQAQAVLVGAVGDGVEIDGALGGVVGDLPGAFAGLFPFPFPVAQEGAGLVAGDAGEQEAGAGVEQRQADRDC